MKKIVSVLLIAAMILSLAACGGAQKESDTTTKAALNFPTKTIEVVNPYTAGGGLDLVTRAAAEALKVGQSVTVTNMVGGSSLVAVMDVANGDKSGHRYVSHHPESMSAYYLGGVFDKDYGQEFNWICCYAYDSMCIVVGKDSPINNWDDLVKDALARPGQQTWGGSGNLSTNHMAAAMAMKKGNFLANYVPYSGAADARIACIGGNLDVFIGQTSEMVSYVESGDLKAIATWSEERVSWMPDVPTVAEILGTKEGTIYGLHRGVMIPKEVPADVRQYLEDAYKAAVTTEEWQKKVSDSLHYEPGFWTGEECAKIAKDSYAFSEEAVAFINEKLNK